MVYIMQIFHLDPARLNFVIHVVLAHSTTSSRRSNASFSSRTFDATSCWRFNRLSLWLPHAVDPCKESSSFEKAANYRISVSFNLLGKWDELPDVLLIYVQRKYVKYLVQWIKMKLLLAS